MPTLEPTKHSPNSTTHSVCEAKLREQGVTASCCLCAPHEGCGLTQPYTSWQREFVEKFFVYNLATKSPAGAEKEAIAFIEKLLVEAQAHGEKIGAEQERNRILDILQKQGQGGGNYKRLIKQLRGE